jgi:hypothetical protein
MKFVCRWLNGLLTRQCSGSERACGDRRRLRASLSVRRAKPVEVGRDSSVPVDEAASGVGPIGDRQMVQSVDYCHCHEGEIKNLSHRYAVA